MSQGEHTRGRYEATDCSSCAEGRLQTQARRFVVRFLIPACTAKRTRPGERRQVVDIVGVGGTQPALFETEPYLGLNRTAFAFHRTIRRRPEDCLSYAVPAMP